MSLLGFISNFFTAPKPTPTPEPLPTIAEIAVANGSFDILVAALNATGLTQTFLDPGDYTVFAPTDDAFKELATTTLGLDIEGLSADDIAGALVAALDAETVKSVLLYHVTGESNDLAHLRADGTVETLLGATFDVSGNVLVDADAGVKNPQFIAGLTDIQASNGVIQVIDRVLLPVDLEEATTPASIADIAVGNDAFEALVAALTATDLVGVVADRDADLTVFAPTDDAFRALAEDLGIDTSEIADADLAGALVNAVGADLITDTLLYHVSGGAKSLAEVQSGKLVQTALADGTFAVDGSTIVDAEIDVANASFVEGLTDLDAVNGTVHVIDRVLLPVDLTPANEFGAGTMSDDILVGGGIRDGLWGRGGDDLILGNAGNDLLGGGGGADTLVGGTGDDVMWGAWGNDTLIDGAGNDRLYGGWGRDTLVDGEGDDVLYGGFLADTFDFSNGAGNDRVADFGWADTLILSKSDFVDFDAVEAASSVTWRGTTIDTDDGSILLQWTYSLDADDIAFV